jgi:uncharacterized protein DUF3667
LDRFLETAGLASVGGWFRRRGKDMEVEVGAPCANCGVPLQGPWCYNCGQAGEDYHRSVFKLIGESIEGLFHADGRLWKTIPHLLYRPGRLTRDYLDGKRAPQIPPFRMFLVILLIVFFAGHLATASKDEAGHEKGAAVHAPTAAERDAASRALSEAKADIARDLGPGAAETFGKTSARIESRMAKAAEPKLPVPPAEGAPPEDPAVVVKKSADTLQNLPIDGHINLDGDAKTTSATERWLETGITAIREDPKRFAMILEIWAHRVAILALPISALLLSILFIFNRRFYVFDHLIFSMHSLTFQLLLLSVIFLLSMLVGPVAWWLIVLSPIHLYKHMRGTYATGRFGTVLRMFFLWIGSTIGFSFLAVLWVALGVNEMAGH